jgi:hypothetical protein
MLLVNEGILVAFATPGPTVVHVVLRHYFSSIAKVFITIVLESDRSVWQSQLCRTIKPLLEPL